jgi:hypothetical protein
MPTETRPRGASWPHDSCHAGVRLAESGWRLHVGRTVYWTHYKRRSEFTFSA